MPLLFEFKARTDDPAALETRLRQLQPRFAGEDFQRDTYFHVPNGRLKLREGPIENALIHYQRPDDPGPKRSDVLLYQPRPAEGLREVLTAALGVLVVVEKKRRIYFVGHVKIHFDVVAELGTFVEVEAIDEDGSIGLPQLMEDCETFARFFGISPEQYQSRSYSDLLLEKGICSGSPQVAQGKR